MSENANACTLPYRSHHCREACRICGWNPEVVKERNAEIKAKGLTRGPDGLRRLVIKKEDDPYGINA